MRNILSVLLLSLIVGCDPGFRVRSFITNESSSPLLVNYHAPAPSRDSSLIIEPNSHIEIYTYGALGEGRDYDCCSCEFSPITLVPVDTSKHLMKDVAYSPNWNLSNTNRKRYDSDEITCEFVVKQSDIQ